MRIQAVCANFLANGPGSCAWAVGRAAQRNVARVQAECDALKGKTYAV